MFSLPFLKQKGVKTSKFLVVTVSSIEVKCLCLYRDSGILRIIGSGKHSLDANAVRNGAIVDLAAVAASTEEAIALATENSEKKVADVFFGISSDLCIENVTTAKINRTSEEPISKKELEGYFSRLKQAALLDAQKRYAQNCGNVDFEMELLSSSTVYAKLDKMPTTSVLDETGKTLELALQTTFCSSYHIKMLSKLSKKLGLRLTGIITKAQAVVSALKPTDYESTDLVTIEVGTDYTTVGVVFGEAVVATRSMHIGLIHFVEQVSKIMGITVSEAKKVIESHGKNELSQSESVVVQNCIQEVLEIWLEGLELIFSDFDGVKTFSSFIYLFGEGTMVGELIETLTTSPWTKSIPFKAPPQIELLNSTNLKDISDSTGAVESNTWLDSIALAQFAMEQI